MWSSWAECRKKPEIDAEIEWDVIEKNTVSLDTDGGVKVLSEKTGYDENFQNDRSVPESIHCFMEFRDVKI